MTFKKHAQDGRGVERPPEELRSVSPRLVARIRALFASSLRAVSLLLFGVSAWAQTNGNFNLSVDPASVSVAAGTSATLPIQVSAKPGYGQPIYLMPGGLPEGITLSIPSPVVGGQTVKIEVKASVGVKLQTYSVTVYAAGAGENHSATFSISVLPEGQVVAPPPAPPEPQPVAIAAVPEPPVAAEPDEPLGSHWVASWGASAVTPSNDSGAYYLTNVTVRQIAHLSIGTKTGLRIKLSNALGKDPVSFGSVHVAQWAGDSSNLTSAVLPESDRVVTFEGSASVVIPGGEEVFSDPIALPLPAGADVAVSLYIPRTSNVPATMHPFGNQTAYFSLGDFTGSRTMPNAATDTVRPYLTGIDVDAPGANAIVALGDSLTDGMLSSRDQNLRWTDDLARRLQTASANRVGIVNAGIAGNCVLMNCMGPTTAERFKRDVLSITGVKSVIVLAGANDIGNAPGLTAEQLTEAYKSMVALAHAQNILIYGATIPPFGGSKYFTPVHEKLRQEVNAFVRSANAFDGVIDFDKALAEPENPAYLRSDLNGDKIRPNDAGYQAMADSINLGVFNLR